MEDQRPKTLEHISEVRNQLNLVINELHDRARDHDASKLEEPEKSIFDEYTPKLKNTTYGSAEYKQYLKEMKKALDHHYAYNRHHPEHFATLKKDTNIFSKLWTKFLTKINNLIEPYLSNRSSVSYMNLIDVIEMFCDWKAATLRHADGDILNSIKINKKRFGMSEQLCQILINTI